MPRRHRARSATAAPAPPAASTPAPTKQPAGKSSKANSLFAWCEEQLRSVSNLDGTCDDGRSGPAGSLDNPLIARACNPDIRASPAVATFVALLLEVESAQNVVEVINEYLGGSADLNPRRFAEEFLTRRKKEGKPAQGPYNVGIITLGPTRPASQGARSAAEPVRRTPGTACFQAIAVG